MDQLSENLNNNNNLNTISNTKNDENDGNIKETNELKELCTNIIMLLYFQSNNSSQIKNPIHKKEIDKIVDSILPFINKKYNITPKKRNRKHIPTCDMCMGRKIDGLQCTRRRLPNMEYCKSHCRKLPNGRVDQPNPAPKVKAKRGRKRKIEFDPRQNDDEYATLWEKILEGKKYLVDIKGHVFTYQNEKLTYIGNKTLEGKIDRVVV
tara:strand:+ start:1854 stop:2477 length:624 start_codon:yes stop_codon:yes gene_type:complete